MEKNLDMVLLVYGLSFVVMGSIIVARPKEESNFAVSKILWLFAAYAFFHAPADFLDMRTVAGTGAPSMVPGALTFVSYLFLFEFGRRLLWITDVRIPGQVLPALIVLIVLFSAWSRDPAADFNVLVGYAIRFPAGLMSGIGFIRYYQIQERKLAQFKVRNRFYTAGAAMIAWAVLCGLVRKTGTFFPSTAVNYDSFFDAVGLPVFVFRTICAVVITWSLWGILSIFIAEARELLQQEIVGHEAADEKNHALIRELQRSLAEIKTLSELLPICSSCKKIRDDKGYWNQLEMYLYEHANARFTHGICPDCCDKLYGDVIARPRPDLQP